MTPADLESHWLVYRDQGWVCTGCDWTGTLDDYMETHGIRKPDDNIPF